MPHILGHVPQTGLIGAEQALQGGFTGGIAGLTQGSQAAIDLLGEGFNRQITGAELALGRGREALTGQTGLGIQALQQGLGAAGGFGTQAGDLLRSSQQLGQNVVGQNIGLGVGGLQGFADPGQQAFQSQAALSGALGPEAQQQAFAQFIESPEQQFITQQGEKGILRQAAALGGLGGGNIQKDILSFGQGQARQAITDRFGRLGELSGLGLQAAGQQGQLRGQQAGLNAQLIGQFGLAGAQNLQQQAQNQLGVGRDILGARTQLGGQLGQLSQTEAANRLGFAEDRVEHNHMLIYVYSRAVLEGIRLDDPFLDRTQVRTEGIKAISFLRFSIKETPAVLKHRVGEQEYMFRGREPLWVWLLPQLLRLLGHSQCLELTEAIEGFLQYTMLVIAQNWTLWDMAPSFLFYLRAITSRK